MTASKLRVFLTGATGFVGAAVRDAMVQAGMEVIGLVRRAEARGVVVAAGAQPVLGDLRAPNGWIDTAADCDVVVHAGQNSMGFPISEASVAATATVDGIALEAILKAAEKGRIRNILYTSGLWSYGDHGDQWITEETPLTPGGVDLLRGEREVRLCGRSRELGVRACVMALGNVYGPGRSFEGYVARARAGQHRYLGEGRNFMSPVHFADVGAAYLKALELGVGGERFNICDDDPMSAGDHANLLCEAVGSRPPTSMCIEEAVALLGNLHAQALSQSIRMSNNKARLLLKWAPRYRSFRTGVREAIGISSAGH